MNKREQKIATDYYNIKSKYTLDEDYTKINKMAKENNLQLTLHKLIDGRFRLNISGKKLYYNNLKTAKALFILCYIVGGIFEEDYMKEFILLSSSLELEEKI